jgi:cation diffusion facilitator CzcD-associated flavoprotein CzcO
MRPSPTAPATDHAPQFECAIIGAGIAGLGMAAMLKARGYSNFVILERAGDIGGVWRDNQYPGVAVDIPSHAYQFSYFPRADWSRMYPRGAEVKAYLEHFGLRPHLRLNNTVIRRDWDEATHCWHLTVGDQVITTRWVISAVGNFLMARSPAIEGLGDFGGSIV